MFRVEENMNFFQKTAYTVCKGEGNKGKECPNYNNGTPKHLTTPENLDACESCSSDVEKILEPDVPKIVAAVIGLLLLLSGLGYWVYLSLPKLIPIPKPTAISGIPSPKPTSTQLEIITPQSTPIQSEKPSPQPIPKPEELPSIQPQNTIKSLDISPDGRTLVGGSEDGKIGVWDTQTGQVRFQLSGHNKPISAIAISADGQTLISASEDGTIKAWDLENRKELYSLTEKSSLNKDNHPITALAVSADGKILVTGGQQNHIQLWNLNSKEFQSLEIQTGVESLAISQDAKVIVSGNYGGKINIWKLNNDRYEKRTFDSEDQEAHSVAISSDGEKIVSSSCKDKIRVWNTNTLEEPSLLSESDNDICLVAISSNAKIVAGLSINKTIKLWDLETRKELSQLFMPSDNSQISEEMRSIAFSGDGQTIAASFGKTIRVWQLPNY
jgi:WD40 repeat protein